MKKYLDQPIIPIKDNTYLTLIMILAPLLNFLSGINIDMYAPSMPSIARYYSISTAIAKNTISITVLGVSIGCLLFGALLDSIGRKRSIILGLFLYTLASFMAALSHSLT